MGHGNRALSSFNWVDGGILIGLILAAILLLVWWYRRTERHGNGLTINECRTLDRTERELLSMVRQYGTAVRQSQIVEEAAGGFDLVTENLRELEAKGLITRIWDSQTNDLMISA